MSQNVKVILGLLGLCAFLFVLVALLCGGLVYLADSGKFICQTQVSSNSYLKVEYENFNLDNPRRHNAFFSSDQRNWKYQDISVLMRNVRDEMGITKDDLDKPNDEYCKNIAKALNQR